jgi:hypothetical protein
MSDVGAVAIGFAISIASRQNHPQRRIVERGRYERCHSPLARAQEATHQDPFGRLAVVLARRERRAEVFIQNEGEHALGGTG